MAAQRVQPDELKVEILVPRGLPGNRVVEGKAERLLAPLHGVT